MYCRATIANTSRYVLADMIIVRFWRWLWMAAAGTSITIRDVRETHASVRMCVDGDC